MQSRTVSIIMATMWLGLGLVFVTASSGRAGDDSTTVAGSTSGMTAAVSSDAIASSGSDAPAAVDSPAVAPLPTLSDDADAAAMPPPNTADGYGADGVSDPQP